MLMNDKIMFDRYYSTTRQKIAKMKSIHSFLNSNYIISYSVDRDMSNFIKKKH